MKFQSSGSTSPATPFIDVPRIISDKETAFGNDNPLRNISCLNDNALWTSVTDEIIRLYNLQGKLLMSLLTILFILIQMIGL